MSRSKNVRKGLLAGVINNLLALALPFVTRTIIIYTFSSAYLGLGGLFTSLISVLSISELGFGSALSYILYKPIAENDTQKVCEILSFAKKVFKIIGSVILTAGLILLPFINSLVSEGCPEEINIYILYVLYLANSVVSYFMFSYKRLLFSASQRYDIETTIASVTLIGQYVLQIIVLLVTKNYYLFVLMMIFASVANNIICEIVTKKYYPQYVCQGKLGGDDIKQVKKHVKGVFASKIGSTVYLSVDNIVISSLFGVVLLGKYSNYHYMVTTLVAFFAIIHNTLRPSLGNYIICENKDNNFETFQKITSVYLWLSTFCACLLICLFQDFIKIWAGESYLFPTLYVFLFTSMFFIDRLNCMPSLYAEAAGLWNESKWVYLLAAFTNLTLNILLAHLIGLPGIPIATMITSIAVCAVGYLYVLFKYYFEKKNQLGLYMKGVLYNVIVQLLIISLVYYISIQITVDSIVMLFVKGALVSLSFLVCFATVYVLDINGMKKNVAFLWSTLKH